MHTLKLKRERERGGEKKIRKRKEERERGERNKRKRKEEKERDDMYVFKNLSHLIACSQLFE